ncbi:AB hydrolase-1 domain-containing protein [Aphelenchoides besseyi]|nr:AB hydrolase-1 domain-containing protein [Aphelenchoides besseyi]
MSNESDPGPQEPPSEVVNQAIGQELLVEDSVVKSFWPRWNQASMAKLIDAEKRLLGKVPAFVQSQFIKVRHYNSSINTITVKKTSDEKPHPVPFVLIHGFAAGIAIWKKNLKDLVETRTVHAFDLMGFGRSSRPPFSTDPTLAELEFVQSIEDWRKAMNLERMILIGHSFGAYLASAYALEHPGRVRHLVLVDPWGFSERPHGAQILIPIWMRAIGSVMSKFNPLAAVRAAGPLGPYLIQKLRADLGVRYSHDDPQAIYDYIYQCNAQAPSGEIAFRSLTRGFGWPRRPMVHRFAGISQGLPVTFVLGSKSWVNSEPIFEIQNNRTACFVKVVNGAGHHVYADQPEQFNRVINDVSEIVDKELDLDPGYKPDQETES